MAADKYYSIRSESHAEIEVKGSRFIAHAGPCHDQNAAAAFTEAICQRFADATHNCFAYKLGIGDSAIFRYSDAGEPSGTAGRPIFQAIETKDLTDVAVVVTRYFGGTKLGTGGLIRAYSAAALAALEHAKVVVHHRQAELSVRFDYQFSNVVHQLVDRFQGRILKTIFETQPVYRIRLKASDLDEFRRLLRDATRGEVEI